ncbi:carboxylesterase [Hydrogenophaga sp. D2P1]|uniref:Carboxylesterase n=1 Tax=Hydrogenophaga aromaticivorans TaxID=2610898 RepID=A0A7Y8KXA1_9BURK|nr:alpha/beta hydrolase-fold protein [Hydrogenophaga aromaticivorans]NWF46380.1 carboxylesterase [Hydrogenophaga aromaticivorans]
MSPNPSIQLREFVTGGDPAAQPAASIIVLHGLGADGSDFVPIAQELDLSAIGPVRFVFPNAPVQPVTINGGYEMRAWYDIYPPGADPAVPRQEDEAGLRLAQTIAQALIDREAGRGVPAERTVLMGFSQGCVVALMAGLRTPQRLAGLVGLSGYLALADRTASEVHAANRATPIFLAHGEADDVVVLERGTAARDALTALGYAVDWHSYPMGHSVCAEEVADLNAFLLRVLAPD